MSKTELVEAFWREFATARGLLDYDINFEHAAFAFGDSPEHADKLLALVVKGDKRATAALLRDFTTGGEPLPKTGNYEICLRGDGTPACVIRLTDVAIKPLSATDEAFAWDEGEGDRSLSYWMDGHVNFFQRYAANEGFEFSTDMETVLQRFEVVWPECPALVRAEAPADLDGVRAVTAEAFAASELGHNGEADAIDAVRAAHPSDIVSLVADSDGAVVGHILFSPVTVGDSRGMGLGPMAVAPAFQNQRVGAALVRAGLRTLRDGGCPFVVVLGHPNYYPRFGFRPAKARSLSCEFDAVDDDAFMVLSLGGALPEGVARYVPELR